MSAEKGNTYAAGNPGGGRPEKYKPEYPRLAYQLCLLGATDADLASCFEVDEGTINKWKLRHEEFSQALKRGKIHADAKIAQALYHRAKGYFHDDVDIRTVSLGDNCGSKIVQTPIVKYYPPDTTACIFWLKNRQKKNWRDKTNVELSADGSFADALIAARERAERADHKKKESD